MAKDLINQSCLCNKVSIKIQKEKVRQTPGEVNVQRCEESGHRSDSISFEPLPHPLPCASLLSGCS